MTTNDHDARPNVPTPINSTTRTALTALAMFFDERSVARSNVAEQQRADEDPGYAEQQSIAETWQYAANVVWQLIGGRPDGSLSFPEYSINISARELGKLIGMATREPLTQTQPSGGALTFDDGLVERLADVYSRAHDATKHGEDFAKNGIRAILSVLASMPVEMPDVDELARVEWIAAYGSDDYTKEKATEPDPAERGACFAEQRRQSIAGLEFVRARLGPILAAKDARIANLDRTAAKERAAAQLAERRLAEKHAPFLMAIDEQKARIAELEKRLADTERSLEWHKQQATAATVELGCAGMTLEEAVRATVKRLTHTPVDAAGKTPGQVHHEALRTAYTDEWGQSIYRTWSDMPHSAAEKSEAVAQAVLRAFGGEALRRVRDKVPGSTWGELTAKEAIDDELSTFGAASNAPMPYAAPRIFLGITFERERPDGSRENVDPSTIRIVVGDDPTPLVMAGVQKDRAT